MFRWHRWQSTWHHSSQLFITFIYHCFLFTNNFCCSMVIVAQEMCKNCYVMVFVALVWTMLIITQHLFQTIILIHSLLGIRAGNPITKPFISEKANHLFYFSPAFEQSPIQWFCMNLELALNSVQLLKKLTFHFSIGFTSLQSNAMYFQISLPRANL